MYAFINAAQCIDMYIALRKNNEIIDALLVDIIARMFKRCFDDGEYTQAIGIALESLRIDVLEHALKGKYLFDYVIDLAVQYVHPISFRNEVLKLCVRLLKEREVMESGDYISICRCLVLLDDALEAAEILKTLAASSDVFSI